ncbi:MAG: RHS repeat-associated core domain-containing protein, partial [Lutisporaceae bacterium]
EITDEDFELGYITYEEKPDYLLDPTSKATYKYDANGNRINYVTDNEALDYEYDAADRLLSDGNDSYSYDANGNMTGVQAGEDTVEYIYNAANKLTEVKYPDGTYVKYGYDAFGRKVSREEAYWNKEADDAPGKSEYAPGQNKEKNNNSNGNSNKKEKVNPLKLKADTTTYLYDGFTNAITNEYTGNGSPLSQYYMANDRVVSKKTFGNHGLVIPGREPSLKTDGGLMYYSYDGMRNVTELTDRHGDSIEQYRYDAFGGLFTGITAPYNTNGFAGKRYDAKANLIDMNARWYGAQNGRFTTADPYTGDILTPYTQNRYAYVGNNPINRWDPLGYWEDGDSGLSSAAQADIRYLTDLYYATEDEDERENIHEAANEIRRLDRDRWTTEDERKIGSWSDDTPDIDYDTSIKLSDGWRTDWTRTDKYYEKYEVTRQRHTAYAGVISTTVSIRTDMTTTVTNGFDFRAFTPSEWYQENKAVLKQYDIPISQVNSYYEPKDAYSKTTSSSRSISSTEKIVSRNDNNDFKNGILAPLLKTAINKDTSTGNKDFIELKSLADDFKNETNPVDKLVTFAKFYVRDIKYRLSIYSEEQTNLALSTGMSPEYANLYGDFATAELGGAFLSQMIKGISGGIKYVNKAGEVVEGATSTEIPQKVIGHYPEYVDMSNKLGTKPFSVPGNIWNKMTPTEQWAANQKFLDRAIAKGSEFNLATPIDKIHSGSYLQKEIEYLISQGYKLSSDGTKLVK